MDGRRDGFFLFGATGFLFYIKKKMGSERGDWNAAGTSFASNAASSIASFGAGKLGANQFVANEIGRLARSTTLQLMGDKNAWGAYQTSNLMGIIGNQVGSRLAAYQNSRTWPQDGKPVNSSLPWREILFGGGAFVATRKDDERTEGMTDEERGYDPLGDDLTGGVNWIGDKISAGAGWLKDNTYNRFKNVARGRGFRSNSEVSQEVIALINEFGEANRIGLTAKLNGSLPISDAAVSYTSSGEKIKKISKSLSKLGFNLDEKRLNIKGETLFRTSEKESLELLMKALNDGRKHDNFTSYGFAYDRDLDEKNVISELYRVDKDYRSLTASGGFGGSYSVSIPGYKLKQTGEELNGVAVHDGSVVQVQYDEESRGAKYTVIQNRDKIRNGANVYVNGISNFKITDVLDSAKLIAQSSEDQPLYAVLNLDSEFGKPSVGNLTKAGLQGYTAVQDSDPAYHEKSQDTLEQLLQTGKKLNIFAHSEGNAIALKALLSQQSNLTNGQITYYGFAPASDGSQVPSFRPGLLSKKSTLFYNRLPGLIGDEAIIGPAAIEGMYNTFKQLPFRLPLAVYTGKWQVLKGDTSIGQMQNRWQSAGYHIRYSDKKKWGAVHSFTRKNFQWALNDIFGR